MRQSQSGQKSVAVHCRLLARSRLVVGRTMHGCRSGYGRLSVGLRSVVGWTTAYCWLNHGRLQARPRSIVGQTTVGCRSDHGRLPIGSRLIVGRTTIDCLSNHGRLPYPDRRFRVRCRGERLGRIAVEIRSESDRIAITALAVAIRSDCGWNSIESRSQC